MKSYIDLNGCGSICFTRLIKALNQIIKDLIELFKKKRKKVPDEYILEGQKRFNWETIITNFWRLCNG